MKKILQKKERVLRKIAKEVSIKEIKTPKIQKVLREMSQALKSQYDGVAIAAPQIGYSLRIFVVSGKVLEADFLERGLSQGDGPRGSAGSSEPDSDPTRENPVVRDLIFINPKISKL
ncbi:MAG: peptide deformylase, partial [Patescibacteria group bacterium]